MECQNLLNFEHLSMIEFHKIKNTLAIGCLLKLSGELNATLKIEFLNQILKLLKIPCSSDFPILLQSFLQSSSSSSNQSMESRSNPVIGYLLCELIDQIRESQTVMTNCSRFKFQASLKFLRIAASSKDWYSQMFKVFNKLKSLQQNINPNQSQHIMFEVYKIIADANIGIVENENANLLRILMMSPFYMTDIDGEMTKNNQQQQYYITHFVQQHKADSLIQWGKQLQEIKFMDVLFAVLDSIQLELEPTKIISFSEYICTLKKVFDAIPDFNYQEKTIDRFISKIVERNQSLKFIPYFFKNRIFQDQTIQNKTDCQLRIILSRLIDFEHDDDIKPILLSNFLPQIPLNYRDEFIVKAFNYLSEKLKSCSDSFQLMHIGTFEKFMDQTNILIIENLSLTKKIRQGENYIYNLMCLIQKFLYLDNLYQRKQNKQKIRRSSSFGQNIHDNIISINKYIQKIYFYFNQLLDQAPQTASILIKNQEKLSLQMIKYVSQMKEFLSKDQIGNFYKNLLTKSSQNDFSLNFVFNAIEIISECQVDFNLDCLLQLLNPHATDPTIIQQAIFYLSLKSPPPSLRQLCEYPSFNQFFPLYSPQRLQLFLNLPLSSLYSYESQIKFLGQQDSSLDDFEKTTSCCINDLTYLAKKFRDEETQINLNRWRVLDQILRNYHGQVGDIIHLVVEKIVQIVQKILGQISSNFVHPQDQEIDEIKQWIKKPSTPAEVRDNDFFFQFDFSQDDAFSHTVSIMSQQWTITRYYEQLAILKSVSNYLKNDVVHFFILNCKEYFIEKNHSLQDTFLRIRTLEGILRELCIPLGYHKYGLKIIKIIRSNYQLHLESMFINENQDIGSSIKQQLALLCIYEQRLNHKLGQPSLQISKDFFQNQEIKRDFQNQKFLQLKFGIIEHLYISGLYQEAFKESQQLEQSIRQSSELFTIGQHFMLIKLDIIKIKSLFRLNKHPEVYNQLKQTKKQAYSILRGLDGIKTSKIKIQNTETDVLQINLSSFIIKFEDIMQTQAISKTKQYQQIRASKRICDIAQSINNDVEFGQTFGPYQALSILRELGKLQSRIRNRAYGINDQFYTTNNLFLLQSSFQMSNFQSFVEFSLDLKLIYQPSNYREKPCYITNINSQQRLKLLPTSTIFPSPLTGDCLKYQLPAAFTSFFSLLQKAINLDHSSKYTMLDDLNQVIEGYKLVVKYALTEWTPKRIGQWIKKDQVKKERCLVREKAKYGFEITQHEVFNYYQQNDKRSQQEDCIDQYMQLLSTIESANYVILPSDYPSFLYFHYRNLAEYSLSTASNDNLCIENISHLVLSRLWPLLDLKILSRNLAQTKQLVNDDDDQSQQFKKSLSHNFIEDDVEMSEERKSDLRSKPQPHEQKKQVDFSKSSTQNQSQQLQLEEQDGNRKIVGISFSKFHKDKIMITVVDQCGNQKYDLTYMVKHQEQVSRFFEGFEILYQRQFVLWKKEKFLSHFHQNQEYSSIRKEVQEEQKKIQTEIAQKFREIDYKMFGMHQILLLGRLKDKKQDSKIWHHTNDLKEKIQSLSGLALSSSQTYYLKQLLVSLISEIIPCYQQINYLEQNYDTNNLSSQMILNHQNKKSLLDVNNNFQVDEKKIINNFIEIVLQNQPHSAKIEGLIQNNLDILRNSSRFIDKNIIFEPVHLIVDPLIANFPFENLHVFKPQIKNDQRSSHRPNSNLKLPSQLCTRLPSIEWFHHNRHLLKNENLTFNKCLVIVDPENNLESTKKKFFTFSKKRNFDSQNFKFLFGKEDVAKLKQEDFFGASIYVYNGHGNGIKFINKIIKENHDENPPLMLIFGCDSVQFDVHNSPSSLMQPKNLTLEKLMQRNYPYVYGTSQTSISSILDHISFYIQNKIAEMKQVSNLLSKYETFQDKREKQILQLIRDAEEDLLVNGGNQISLDQYYGFGAYMMSYGIAPNKIEYH